MLNRRVSVILAVVLLLAGCTNNPTTSTTPTTQSGSQSSVSSTTADVATHATADDCWMVINQQVYDVTTFISQHPGRDKILDGCGQDATALFGGDNFMGHAHSAMAQGLLKKYLQGPLAH